MVPHGLSRQRLPLVRARISSKAYIRRHFNAEIPRIELKNPVKLQDFVVDGKIELSLKNYLDLVMANNTDIQITKLNVETSRMPSNGPSASLIRRFWRDLQRPGRTHRLGRARWRQHS